jgi:aerobic carbon-monoxide dehydrogenase medium subunit
MKTPAFEYRAPRTIDEALALLAEHAGDAKVLAGGQSLVPLLAMRLARPTQLVDINEIDELAGIRPSNGTGVAFGALTRERAAEHSPLVAERAPLLAEALPFIGHVSIRNRGTIGGSIAHADASAELPAVAVITGAEMVVRSARAERVIPADDFFVGHFTTSMADDELLTEIRIPSGPDHAGWAFHEIARRHGDFALVGVAAMVTITDGRVGEARIAMMGVADRAVRASEAEAALIGQGTDARTIDAAAHEAIRNLEPASDIHGSAEFRRHLAGVATRRALTTAVQRAGGAQ